MARLSATGARSEVPRGWDVGRGVPLPLAVGSGEGALPPLQKNI